MIERLRRLGPRLRTEQRGITLVELMVAMGLTALIVAAAVGFYISGAKATAIAQNVDTATRQASNGMSELARMIRAATANPIANPTPGGDTTTPAVVSGTATSVRLYAYVNLSGSSESPVMVDFTVKPNGQLVETVYPATTTVAGANGHWDFSTTASSTRILCDSVRSGTTLFHYLPAGGTPELPAPGTTTSNLTKVRAIQVTLTVQPGAASTAVTLTNTVGMPNLGFSTTDSGS